MSTATNIRERVPEVRCSDVEPEPLPGTAKQADIYVVLEWPTSWSRDVLDGDTFGEELTKKLKAHLKKYGASLQLIRHPTRERRQIADHHLYLVFAEEGIIEVAHIDDPIEVLEFDLSGPGKNNLQRRERPLALICTHAKRDACCAIKGRPLVNELERRYPFAEHGDLVWETSHTKGHRFAPAMLLMPWGYSFGRMNAEATAAMVEAAVEGEYFVPGNRGRGTLSAPGQVAELAVARMLADRGEVVRYGQLDVTAEGKASKKGPAVLVVVDKRSGAQYKVELVMRTVEGVISSCGAEPKTGKYWAVESVAAI